MENYLRTRVPWSTQPSLKCKSAEAGVDFDRFIAALKEQRSDQEMAQEFAVSEKTIASLREHFERYGLGSIMGQD
ncbi:MAG: helix-turn-helix domain-containing protein [Desulfurispora sp.]|uniref:helix-turn-helix domain-containing protein n=1 Tax=Desulfurispora sp. TaxID=3014275 RepID=UPI00404A7A91